jgi:hypothetical protein
MKTAHEVFYAQSFFFYILERFRFEQVFAKRVKMW